MRGLVDKNQTSTPQTAHSSASPARGKADSTLPQLSNRPEAIIQRKLQDQTNFHPDLARLGALQERANHSPQALQLAQLQERANSAAARKNWPTASAVEGPPAVLPAPALRVSPSLLVGRADDPAERQADAMADAALASLAGSGQPHSGVVSRSAAAGDQLGGLAVAAPVQREIDTARGGRSALGQREVSMFSGAYGVDLSPVRVHTDSSADGLSRSLQAHAFTTGSDVFFRSGTYKPGTESGDRLIGHELAHVATEGGAARRSMAPIRRWGEWLPTWKNNSEELTEGGSTLLGMLGGVSDLINTAGTSMRGAGEMTGKNAMAFSGMSAVTGGIIGLHQAGMSGYGFLNDLSRYRKGDGTGTGPHAIDARLGKRGMVNNAKGVIDGLGSLASSGWAIAEMTGAAVAQGAQAVPGLGTALSALMFGQGAYRAHNNKIKLNSLTEIQNNPRALQTDKAKQGWLPVLIRKYNRKVRANRGKMIISGLGIAVGAVGLAGLMATPVGWGLAGAALTAGLIYGGIKIRKMYSENRKKKNFTTADNSGKDGAGKIDDLREALTTAQDNLEAENRRHAAAMAQINTAIADKATEMSPMGSIDTATGKITTDLTQDILAKENAIGVHKEKLVGLRFQAAKAKESRNKAKKALDSLTEQITAETTDLDRTTAMINAAASAAMKAKQDSAETEEAFTNNKKDFDQVAAKHNKVIEQLNPKGDLGNKTAMQNSLSQNKKRLKLLKVAYFSADSKLNSGTGLKTQAETHKVTLNRELVELNDKKQKIPVLNTEWAQLNTHKNNETNLHSGSVNTHEANIDGELGKEKDLNRYAQKGFTNTANIVAYEMASAVKRHADQDFSQTLSGSPNVLQKVITDEGKDAILLAQTMNVKPDELGIATPQTQPVPDPSKVNQNLLIELIEAKLSVSKNM
jgi:hypothetical protein